MESPFPGMNPWLERHWRDMHTRLMVYVGDAIQEYLPDDLVARVKEFVTIESEIEHRSYVAPDVSIAEKSGFNEDVIESQQASATAVAVPLVVTVDRVDRHIEIVDSSSGDRIVTVVEILSPSNKLPGADRGRYLAKQQSYLASDANLVEIDLIRSGDFVVAASPGNLPPDYLEPYIVCVRRAANRDEAEVYHFPLRETLPTIRMPLRPTDRDISLDLQEMVQICYVRGRYDRQVDYEADPHPRLSSSDQEWAVEVLRNAELRN